MTHVYDRDGRAPENLALVKFAGDMLARHHAWFPYTDSDWRDRVAGVSGYSGKKSMPGPRGSKCWRPATRDFPHLRGVVARVVS